MALGADQSAVQNAELQNSILEFIKAGQRAVHDACAGKIDSNLNADRKKKDTKHEKAQQNQTVSNEGKLSLQIIKLHLFRYRNDAKSNSFSINLVFLH